MSTEERVVALEKRVETLEKSLKSHARRLLSPRELTWAVIIIAVAFLAIYLARGYIGSLDHATVINRMVILSGLAAVGSLAWALELRASAHKKPGYLLLAFWILVPPIWFLSEYSFWPHDTDARFAHGAEMRYSTRGGTSG